MIYITLIFRLLYWYTQCPCFRLLFIYYWYFCSLYLCNISSLNHFADINAGISNYYIYSMSVFQIILLREYFRLFCLCNVDMLNYSGNANVGISGYCIYLMLIFQIFIELIIEIIISGCSFNILLIFQITLLIIKIIWLFYSSCIIELFFDLMSVCQIICWYDINIIDSLVQNINRWRNAASNECMDLFTKRKGDTI